MPFPGSGDRLALPTELQTARLGEDLREDRREDCREDCREDPDSCVETKRLSLLRGVILGLYVALTHL